MNYKNYIAFLLVAIIFIKFVAVDSKLLGTIFNSDEIAFVNKSCKFDYYKILPVQESYSESSFALTISYHSFCNSSFNFEIAEWTDEVAELNFINYGSPIIALRTSYNSKISPPPQV
ncbi:MAG TPA: hypothetical protein VK941_01455 [Gillisia sp.]|nr:hypothetical protein [Gillisia sp.]